MGSARGEEARQRPWRHCRRYFRAASAHHSGSISGVDPALIAQGTAVTPDRAHDVAMHVLVASRWYPAFDNPGRGIFVADQVAALAASGIGVRVASWETAFFRGTYAARHGRLPEQETPGAWLEAAGGGHAAWEPNAWGARGVPVTRLPAVTPVLPNAPVDLLAVAGRQAETLLAFGTDLDARWRIDVVHAHTGVPDGLAARALADRLGVPLVVTEHDSTIRAKLADPRIRAAYRTLLDPGREVLTPEDSGRALLAVALGVREGLIGVVPNVVDIAAFVAARPTERNSNELLWVGRRSENKGTSVLLVAFRELLDERPTLRLRLIGGARSQADEDRYRAMAAHLGIAEAVAFEPPTDRAGVAAAMARARVLVHPSPFETFGVVAAEALAAGLPVAATPSGGVESVVGRDGKCGVIAAGIDAPSLAAAVRDVLARPGAFDPATLRARVTSRYAPGIVAAQLADLYGRALAEVGTGHLHADPGPAKHGRSQPGSATAQAARIPGAAPSSELAVPLVVGLRRTETVRRLAALPRSLVAEIVVVTSSDGLQARDSPTLPDGPQWLEIDPDRTYRDARGRLGGELLQGSWLARALRVIRHPVRTWRRRRLATRRTALAVASIQAGLREALALVAGGDAPVEILPLDADDLTVALPLLDSRTRLYPSLLRGLVDAWDARGRPPDRPARSIRIGSFRSPSPNGRTATRVMPRRRSTTRPRPTACPPTRATARRTSIRSARHSRDSAS